MQTIRTTITLPKDTHENLKTLAFLSGQSLNSLILSKLEVDKEKEIKKRKKAFNSILRLRKKINTKGINYRELIENGRRY